VPDLGVLFVKLVEFTLPRRKRLTRDSCRQLKTYLLKEEHLITDENGEIHKSLPSGNVQTYGIEMILLDLPKLITSESASTHFNAPHNSFSTHLSLERGKRIPRLGGDMYRARIILRMIYRASTGQSLQTSLADEGVHTGFMPFFLHARKAQNTPSAQCCFS
jgi:hypothetical protein